MHLVILEMFLIYLQATNVVGAGSGAELDVIIAKGGHGFNGSVEELGGFFVMLNTTLEGTEILTLATLRIIQTTLEKLL